MRASSAAKPTGDSSIQLRTAAETLQASGHAVVALDPAGHITVWNERAVELSGWSAGTVLGRALYDLLVGPSRLRLGEGLSRLAAGHAWQAELDLEGPRGKALRLEVSADPVLSSGLPSGSVLVLRALTGEELERRLHELGTVLRLVPDGVLIVDAEARIREWNQAAEAMFGWSRTLILGTPVELLLPEDGVPEFQQVWGHLVAGAHVAPYETRGLGVDGAEHRVAVHPAALHERGTFLGAVATLRQLPSWQPGESRLSQLVAEVPVAVVAYDEHSRVTFAAGGGYLRSGIEPPFVQGTTLLEALPAGSSLHRAVETSLAGEVSQVQMQCDDRVWQYHVAPAPAGGFVSAFDVTRQPDLAVRLQAQLAAAPLALLTFDATGHATFAAGTGFKATSVDPGKLVGLNLLEVCADSPEISQAVASCLAGNSADLVAEFEGQLWDLNYRSCRAGDGSVAGGICIGQDATSWRRLSQQPVDAAPVAGPPAGVLERDALTGLPGRHAIVRRLAEPVAEGIARAVALLEIDDIALLKEAHDLDGVEVATQVLAGRLLTACGSVFLGRWTHNGFAVVLDGRLAEEDLATLCAELTTAVSRVISLPSGEAYLGSTVGTASTRETPVAGLLEAAEDAVRRARADRMAQSRWLVEPADSRRRDSVVAVTRLREALANDELQLHYQPVVSVDNREPVAVEALIRWEHPTEGLLGPAAFIPLAQRSGLIHELGRWTTRQVCEQANRLARDGAPLQVSVNVSAPQLVRPDLVDQFVEVLIETGCPAARLTIEITETALTTDLDRAVSALQRLKNLGCTLALDDFGTGHSSLLYLRRFPVDLLKIDRSFVAGLGINPEDTAIVASIVSLGQNVGVRCIAEGVETLPQLRLLADMGCDMAQGYLFSRALPPAQLTAWLSEQSDQQARASQLVFDPPEAESVTDEILSLHAEGASLHTIAAALNLAGHRTQRGVRWSAQSVAQVIASSIFPRARAPKP